MSLKAALVVGIDSYPNNPLNYCVNDAKEIGELLAFPEYEFDVQTVLDGDATRRNILQAANSLFRKKPGFALFYFAGHGLTTRLGSYLMTVDADTVEPGVELAYLKKLVTTADPSIGTIAIILDCCHSGSAQISRAGLVGSRTITSDDIDVVMRSIGKVGSSRVLLAACQQHELAGETPDLSHGIFTHYLLEGLYGDAADEKGEVTAPVLYDYIAKRFGETAGQTPVFKGDVVGSIVLGHGLSPRHRTILPSEKVRSIELQAEELINEYTQSTSADLQSWDASVYKSACLALSPVLIWFDKRYRQYPQLSASKKFKSAWSTAQAKRAELGHLKEGLVTSLGTVVSKLGAGTFGTVWEIRQDDDQSTAYKVYHPMDLDNIEKKRRFERGYEAMKQLDHPNVVKVIQRTDCPYGFTMQFVDGHNLRSFAYMDTAPKDIIRQLLDVGETLKHAHEKRVIHRDVKPENIIMRKASVAGESVYNPYLTDFDLAWFSTATQFTKEGVGTLIYAAPEQISKPGSNAAHSKTTDVYAFGQLLFFFLCKRDPVPGSDADNPRALRGSVGSWVNREPAQKLVKLYEECVSLKPSARIQDFREICDRLFEIHQLLTEEDHRKSLKFSSFAKQLIFSIVGLSDDARVSDNAFHTKTRQYRVEMSHEEQSSGLCNVVFEIIAQVEPVVEGTSNYKEVRRKLNKRIDTTLRPYKQKVSRRAGTTGPYSTQLTVSKIKLNIDSVESCRQVLMRVINCLEGN